MIIFFLNVVKRLTFMGGGAIIKIGNFCRENRYEK